MSRINCKLHTAQIKMISRFRNDFDFSLIRFICFVTRTKNIMAQFLSCFQFESLQMSVSRARVLITNRQHKF